MLIYRRTRNLDSSLRLVNVKDDLHSESGLSENVVRKRVGGFDFFFFFLNYLLARRAGRGRGIIKRTCFNVVIAR